jgi:hypothetical protein
MPLITPVLDDRSFEDLFAELRARIPVYNPSWTDHHDSDPGITLLQLFAYLGEGLQFRLNQVPEATQLAFLRLLDIPLRPAEPARALLRFSSRQAAGVVLRRGDQVLAGKTAFTLADELTAWPLDCVTVSRRALLDEAEAADPARLRAFIAGLDVEVGRALQGRIDALRDTPAGADAPVAPYEAVFLDSEGRSPPLDPAAAVDPMLWIAVLADADSGLAPADLPDPVAGLRNAPGRPLLLNLGYRPAARWPALDEIGPCGADDAAALNWQASIVRSDGRLGWLAVRSAGDSTAGLTREGIVRLELPDTLARLGVPTPEPGLEGSGEQPPELDDARAERLWFWLRVWRGDGSRFPLVQWVGLNAAACEQTVAAAPELLGSGNGQPGQAFRLAQAPVAAGHGVRLQVEEEGGVWQDWSAVDTLDGAGPDDRVFGVDAEAGVVRFGDGARARVPQPGQRVRVSHYRVGGGAAGNVPALAIDKLGAALPGADPPAPLLRAGAAGGLKITNPFAAEGGADAETLDEALARLPTELRRNHRAVAQDDFADLARRTPGAEIARAECLPLFHAPDRTRRPGCVSVIVWPARDPRRPTAPLPDARLLEAVCRWLDRWRLVTTELYVAPPTYRRIAVAVAVQVAAGHALDAVRDWVGAALRQYLAPLPPWGPAGQGWPLGRRVLARELEGVVMQVEGVEYVEALRLDVATPVAGEPGAETWAALPERLLEAWELPELAQVTVLDAATPLPAPGTEVEPPPGRPPVAVPVLRDVC